MNTIKRKAITISLLDENQKPTMVWKVKNAFPVKVTGTDLKAEGNEVAIECIEIAHEGFEIENG
jgi:phage tail-like protein